MQQAGIFLLLPLVGGYIFVQGCYLTKFFVQREDGHRLYFRAAYWGAILFLVAILLRIGLSQVDCLLAADEAVASIWGTFAPRDAGFVTICVYALFLGHTYHLYNLCLDHVWWLECAIEEHGSDLDCFLYQSIKDEASIMVTLDSGKVYIGFATSVTKSAREKTDFVLLPLLSGYRSKDDMRLVPTTPYYAVYQDLPQGQNTRRDFEVVIPVSRLVSCGRFDFDAYAKFNPNAGEMLARLAPSSQSPQAASAAQPPKPKETG